ncbi:MAG: RcnB family protein [Sphingomonadaceae bacterium]|nr:RcnB family protein [Sphingomonadaceae bacterium]
MRKALIGLILAGAAMVPAAAQAQHWRDGGQGERGSDRGEARSEQVQQWRQERQARQAQQAQQAPQQQVQAQQAPQAYVRQNDGGRGNWQGRGGDNGGRANWQGRGGDAGGRANWQGRGDAGAQGNWQGRNDGNNWRGRDRTNQQSVYPQAWQGNPNDPRLQHYQEIERRNQQRYGNGGRDYRNNDYRNNDRGDWRNNNRGDWRGDRGDNRRGNWNRNWRNDNRYDWQRYRYSNRDIFHIGPYYSPYRGYSYSRFSIGALLDPFFYDQRYWIGDPWEYRLPPALPGTQWVRYYDDVLLVDVYTGEVIDVIYDFFW